MTVLVSISPGSDREGFCMTWRRYNSKLDSGLTHVASAKTTDELETEVEDFRLRPPYACAIGRNALVGYDPT